MKNWLAERFPLCPLLSWFTDYPVPRKAKYWGLYGWLSFFALLLMLLSGLFLAIHYVPDVNLAFASVQKIMREVEYGWLIRSLHSVGASLFFAVAYFHTFRSLWFRSYLPPRELVWISGVILLMLMMAAGFSGYVLVWGQMSYWAVTVVSSLFSAIPIVGEEITRIIRGGGGVGQATLSRFYVLHFTLPFILVGFSALHIYLSRKAKKRPLKAEVSKAGGYVSFHPFYTLRLVLGAAIFMLVMLGLVFFAPDLLNNPDNNQPADALATPLQIAPEWYLLPWFSILRSTDNALLGVSLMCGALLVLFPLPWLDSVHNGGKGKRLLRKGFFWLFVLDFMILGWLGLKPIVGAYALACKIATFYYFSHFLLVLPLLGMRKKPLKKLVTALVLSLIFPTLAQAKEGNSQNGFTVYGQVCSACHSLNYLRYADLQKLGVEWAKIESIAAEETFAGGFDEEGEPKKRKGRPYDYMAKPYPNVKYARFMNFGAVPPDLTNMLKTRKYREQGTLEAYLLAFGKEAPKDLNIADGFSYNPLVDGQITAMPPPFVKGDVTYDDGSEPDEEQIAKDITAFLEFTADTHKTERETAARIAFPIFFLLVLVLWALKRA